VVAARNNKTIKRRTLASILGQAGLATEELKRLL
jgi:hypothetical protein